MAKQIIEVFQSDSEIVNEVYNSNSNYCIEFNTEVPKEYCAIYFASNFIYFPNDERSFKKSVINNDRYEWSNLKLENAHKHIFIRDIKKQWYLTGINSELNDPESLLEFLKEETKNYKVIAVGSSAGGYAAVLYGQQLHAEKTYSFNGQMELESLLQTSSEKKDPVLFRNQSNIKLRPYYDLKEFIINPETIYYFTSARSNWDKEQSLHINDLNINTIFFKTGHHGVPFPKIVLNKVLHLNQEDLSKLAGKYHNPIIFSMKNVGVLKTLSFLIKALKKKFLNNA